MKIRIEYILLKIISVYVLVMISCSDKPNRLEFVQYPDMKLGFTSQQFTFSLPVNVTNTLKLLDYASEKGFSFFELRDPDAVLSLDECREIAKYAKKKKIEVAYANQRGLLDKDFWVVFEKGIKNAAVFDGPKTLRATISGLNFSENPEKTGLSREEFVKVVETANRASEMAEKNGLHLVIENGNEILIEREEDIYGFRFVMKSVSRRIGWQFDSANPFINANRYIHPLEAKAYLEENAGRIKYVHLKAAKDLQSQKTLCDNDLPFDEIFKILAEKKVKLISIELLADSTEKNVFDNMKRSIEYLRLKGFIR